MDRYSTEIIYQGMDVKDASVCPKINEHNVII